MQKEDQLQIACMNYLRAQYPGVLAFHVPNGGSRNAREGAKFKKMGVVRGVPDILVLESRNYGVSGYDCGLAIELKIKPNRPTKEQKLMLVRFAKQGWIAKVCYDFDDFQKVVDEYLKG